DRHRRRRRPVRRARLSYDPHVAEPERPVQGWPCHRSGRQEATRGNCQIRQPLSRYPATCPKVDCADRWEPRLKKGLSKLIAPCLTPTPLRFPPSRKEPPPASERSSLTAGARDRRCGRFPKQISRWRL